MNLESQSALLEGRSINSGGMPRCVVDCRKLPAVDADNLAVVRRAFQRATPCALRQAWLTKEQAGFAPAVVRTGWRADVLLVFAELADADIFSHATGPRQRVWELGDTFEIFLQPEGGGAYVELHVTPGNQQLQLRYEDGTALEEARGSRSFESALLPDGVFRSVTWLEPRAQRWCVYAEIPADLVCPTRGSLSGHRWRFSFSRYDYTRGQAEPVISSTSPHAEPDFHRTHEWGVLVFQPSTQHETHE